MIILFILYFSNNWLKLIEENQKKLLSTEVIQRYKEWFEYLPSASTPAESRYRCRLCYKYYDKLRLDVRYRNALAVESGVLKDTKEQNNYVLGRHEHTSHKTVVEMLQKQAQEKLRTDFEKIRRKEASRDDHLLEITSRMMRTVYVINKLTISFSSHEGIVLLQKLNGLEMGHHHYERTSCTRMTELISHSMHEVMLEQILKRNSPISIIVDGTTDSSRVHYMIVYFQTIEERNPVIYFYRILEVHKETSQGLFDALMNAWKNEKKDLYNYMRKNLIGFASDGASVNVGRKGGLAQHLKNFAENPLFAIHCMAHRLELAIQHSFDDSVELKKLGKDMDKLINSVYSFYNDKSHKRKTHLKDTAEKLKVQFIELIYIFDVRWIASNYRAMRKISEMWKVLVTDLSEISQDNHFSQSARKKANELQSSLKGKNFLLLFNLMYDVTNELKFWSLELQRRSGLLIDFFSFKTRIVGTFFQLKNENGRYLTTFLNDAVCVLNINNIQPCNTVQNYDTAGLIKYQDIDLLDDIDTMPSLGTVRESFLDELIAELNSYFPDGNLEDFDILSPKRMPNANEEVKCRTYGIIEIRNIAKYFKIDENAVLDEWQTLLLSVVRSKNYCTIKKEETEALVFWSELLKWPDIAWAENIEKLILTVLVLPISSAEAERGFSTLNYVRNDRRTKLTKDNLENVMRIKLNGPDELDKFGAVKYAEKWIKAGHMRTDDPQGKRKIISTDLLINEEKKKYMLKSTIF